MKREKTFDCVKMKDEIQEKLLHRWRGLSGSELIDRMKQDIAKSDSSIAEWWRNVQKDKATSEKRLHLVH